jgi:hypothetical protein
MSKLLAKLMQETGLGTAPCSIALEETNADLQPYAGFKPELIAA